MTHLKASPSVLDSTLPSLVVVLTGGAAGIGLATVSLFIFHGARVVFGDVQDRLGEEAASRLGFNATYQHCDASNYADQLALFDTAVRKYGRVDVAVANAGVTVGKSLFGLDSDWRAEPQGRELAELEVNLKGALWTARIANGIFREQGSEGDIVFVSSIAGFKESAGLPVYTASKHGVVGLVRGLHLSAIKENVRVNVVCPWMTKTNMAASWGQAWCDRNLPSNEPEDVACAILICASANRSCHESSHSGVVLPFAGKIVWVGGGESYEIEDRLQALEPEWLGKENSRVLVKGQEFLEEMGDWSKGVPAAKKV